MLLFINIDGIVHLLLLYDGQYHVKTSIILFFDITGLNNKKSLSCLRNLQDKKEAPFAMHLFVRPGSSMVTRWLVYFWDSPLSFR